jgi:DnaJ-class molecular chaperone
MVMRVESEKIVMCYRCNGTGNTSAELYQETCIDCHGTGYIKVL